MENYSMAFDELNVLMAFSFRNSANQDKDINKRAEIVIDDLLAFLILAYIQGIQDISEMLGIKIEADLQKMHKAIYKKVDGEDFTDRIRKYVLNEDLPSLLKVAETEYHRILNTALQDGA